MGDRYDRPAPAWLKKWQFREPELALEPLSPAPIGHNGGPELEDSGYLWRKHCWTAAHKEAWKTPPLDVLRFRVARAEAAGLTYRDYMLTLLDTGRYPQKGTGMGKKKANSE